MNKGELAAQVAINGCITKTQAMATIDAIQSAITAEIQAGRSISLIGFATFGASTRKARKGKNPRTGEPLDIPARRVPSATFSRAFRDTL